MSEFTLQLEYLVLQKNWNSESILSRLVPTLARQCPLIFIEIVLNFVKRGAKYRGRNCTAENSTAAFVIIFIMI